MKWRKRTAALAAALLVLFSLTAQAGASAAQEEIQVWLCYDIAVAYNGRIQALEDDAGKPVPILLSRGTAYLPARVMGNMLGFAVDWEPDAQTVLLRDAAPENAGLETAGEASGGREEARAWRCPGVTVTYNGEVRPLRDVNGDRVCPIFFQDAVYLPVRAVAGLLGLIVDWRAGTEKILLCSPAYALRYGDLDLSAVYTVSGGEKVTVLEYVEQMAEYGCSDGEIDAFLDRYRAKLEAEEKFSCGEWTWYEPEDYAEIDCTAAEAGYIRFRWTRQISSGVSVRVSCGGETHWLSQPFEPAMLGVWQTVPLSYGSGDYTVRISPIYDNTKNDLENYGTYGCWGGDLDAAFTAGIAAPEEVFLLSHIHVDYENAPKTRAKALELTRDRGTDAGKITAVYEYLAENLSYDHALAEANLAAESTGKSSAAINASRDLKLDHILESGTGICEHYAVLMAGMLRSAGVPCKVVSGKARTSGGAWVGHAWVAVRPETGTLDLQGLGAGREPDGKWIRLDPTNAHARDRTALDENYRTEYYY